MNPTETFPHRCMGRDDRGVLNWHCRCGAHPVWYSDVIAMSGWGSDCPAALREALEAERARVSGPHITPALMRRIEALGFTPGSGEPVGWLVGYAVGLAALLTTAQGERDELAAALANERATPPSATELLMRARDAFAASGNGFVSIFSADERWFAAITQVRDRRHAAALLRWRGGGAS